MLDFQTTNYNFSTNQRKRNFTKPLERFREVMGINGEWQFPIIIGCFLTCFIKVSICQTSTLPEFTFETTATHDLNSTEDTLVSDQDVQVRVAPPDPTRRCDVIFEDATFTITSVNYPRYYDNNLDCKYTVNRYRDDYCRLELIFREFNVEPTPGCVADYFLIEQDRFCGFFPPGTRRVYSFDDTANSMNLQFRTNAFAVGPGYLIDGRQLQCGATTPGGSRCDQTIIEPFFVLRSPNFPANYGNNLDCTYTILKASPSMCSVRLTFTVFDLETSVDCNFDYLQIENERICFFPPGGIRTVNFVNSEVRIHFHTDEGTTMRGFDIRGQQIQGPCLGPGSPQIPAPPLPIPGVQPFPPPPPPPPFPPFISQVPFPPPFPPQPQPLPPITNNCRAMFTTASFDMTSPTMYPLPFGSPAIDCSYSIRKVSPDICRLQLTFNSFNLNPSPGCSTDYLLVDGERLCGVFSQGTVRAFDFPSNDLDIRLHSQSQDPRNGYAMTAQQMQCKNKNNNKPKLSNGYCNSEFRTELFTLASPNYPGPYPPGIHCNYLVLKSSPDVCTLQVRINMFDIEAEQGCNKDYLSVGGQRLCGRFQPGTIRTYPFNGPDLTITFHTDNAGGYSGFYVDIMQLRCGPQGTFPFSAMGNNGQDLSLDSGLQDSRSPCGTIHQTGSEVVLVSPGYPEPYPNNMDCTYTFRKFDANTCQFSATFQMFDVESSPACAYDYLRISGRRICGQLQPGTTETFPFNGQEFVLSFLSDAATTGRGFYMNGREIPCGTSGQLAQLDTVQEPLPALPSIPQAATQDMYPVIALPSDNESCHQRFAAKVFRIISPGYPMAYTNRLDCLYTIIKSSDSVCQLQVQMAAFDVEYHMDCLNDFLLIGTLRICGYFPQGTNRNFDFVDRETTFRFVTNEQVTRPGFVLDIIQTECGKTQIPPSGIPMNADPRVPARPAECGKTVFGQVETFASDNFPQPYLNGQRCVYTLQKSGQEICAVDVVFQTMELENSSECIKDFLLIGGQKLCGALPAGTIRRYKFSSEEFTVEFKTDDYGVGPGFFLQLTQIPCLEGGIIQRSSPDDSQAAQSERSIYCDIEITNYNFGIASPRYPLMYPNNADCAYTIMKYHPSVCTLWLDFVLFDVELSAGCQDDYLDVDGEKLCGALPDNTPRIVAFNGERITLRFHSNSKDNRVGFYIQGQQQSCNAQQEIIPMPTSGRSNMKRSRSHSGNDTSTTSSQPTITTTFNSTESNSTIELSASTTEKIVN